METRAHFATVIGNRPVGRSRGGPPRKGCTGAIALAAVFILAFASLATADVRDLVVTDVAARTFSVVWVSEEPVTAVSVRVFADADGLVELTSVVDQEPESERFPPAHEAGIVKVSVSGLESGTAYFVQAVTTTQSETVAYPSPGELAVVTTAAESSAQTSAGAPLANDLVIQDVPAPDGSADSAGILLLLEVPALSSYPLTAFVGGGVELPAALVDLGNLVGEASGTNVQVPDGSVMRLTAYRGLLCAALNGHKLERYRRVPVRQETTPIARIEEPVSCFAPGGTAADFNCDAQIGGDFNLLLSHFGLTRGSGSVDCRFHDDYDLNRDQRIGTGDFEHLLPVFGASE